MPQQQVRPQGQRRIPLPAAQGDDGAYAQPLRRPHAFRRGLGGTVQLAGDTVQIGQPLHLHRLRPFRRTPLHLGGPASAGRRAEQETAAHEQRAQPENTP